jgi:hypothetical protein
MRNAFWDEVASLKLRFATLTSFQCERLADVGLGVGLSALFGPSFIPGTEMFGGERKVSPRFSFVHFPSYGLSD